MIQKGRIIEFRIPGDPSPYHGWKRPQQKWRRMVPPVRFTNMRAYQACITLWILKEWGQDHRIEGLVYCGIDFYRAVPKSCPKTPAKREAWLKLHIGMRPDWDNYYKAALDALQGCLLGDDSRNLGPGPLGGEKGYDQDGVGYTIVRIQQVGQEAK